jgi:pectate lyase
MKIKILLCALALLTSGSGLVNAADGWASVNGNTTGGAGGTTVTATTATAFKNYCTSNGPLIIQVSGTLDMGSTSAKVTQPNKTIIGLSATAKILGNLELNAVSNVIVTNLNFTNPNNTGGGDGITSQTGSHHIWITHCAFVDCADGEIDPTKQSDYVTVSWCKFSYTRDAGHNFVNLIGSADTDTADRGKLQETWHHNWWSTLCKERMPRVRFGKVHTYNNYYAAAANNYNIGVGCESQILIENNYFDSQSNPWKNYSSSCVQGLIHTNAGNVFVSTTIPTWAPQSTIFTPPYSYTLDTAATAKTAITDAVTGAGPH